LRDLFGVATPPWDRALEPELDRLAGEPSLLG
jgi:hypothetical protein